MFLTILRKRGDGDCDCCAAFQCDDASLNIPASKWALQCLEHLRYVNAGEEFIVVQLANVDDVVTNEADNIEPILS